MAKVSRFEKLFDGKVPIAISVVARRARFSDALKRTDCPLLIYFAL